MSTIPVTIRYADLVDSVAAALQYISYYHPADYIAHLARAYAAEQSPAAKDAIAQILTNSKMCAEGRRPICQDTGIVNVFLKIGMDVRFSGFDGSIEDAVNEGVRRAYNFADNKLRASIVADPHFERKNTKDNTPAVIHMTVIPGNTVDVQVAAKGGGSENKTKFVMMNPSDSLVDWVMKTVPTMGAGWCPPGMLGIGIGGTAERAMLLAKQSLMEDIDMYELKARGPRDKIEELRIELCDKINALGIGAQGLGGLTTVLDVKIATYPTHAASKPVAMIPNCAATRHAHFVLDGSGHRLIGVLQTLQMPALRAAIAHLDHRALVELPLQVDQVHHRVGVLNAGLHTPQGRRCGQDPRAGRSREEVAEAEIGNVRIGEPSHSSGHAAVEVKA